MRSDRYLNFVLTIIALCLVFLCLRPWLGADFVKPAAADTPPTPVRVVIAGYEGATQNMNPPGLPVYILGTANGPGSVAVRLDPTAGSLPVQLDLNAGPLPVNVVSSVELGVSMAN